MLSINENNSTQDEKKTNDSRAVSQYFHQKFFVRPTQKFFYQHCDKYFCCVRCDGLCQNVACKCFSFTQHMREAAEAYNQ